MNNKMSKVSQGEALNEAILKTLLMINKSTIGVVNATSVLDGGETVFDIQILENKSQNGKISIGNIYGIKRLYSGIFEPIVAGDFVYLGFLNINPKTTYSTGLAGTQTTLDTINQQNCFITGKCSINSDAIKFAGSVYDNLSYGFGSQKAYIKIDDSNKFTFKNSQGDLKELIKTKLKAVFTDLVLKINTLQIFDSHNLPCTIQNPIEIETAWAVFELEIDKLFS